MKRIWPLCLILYILIAGPIVCFSQLINQHHYTKIEILQEHTMRVLVDSVYIDTLIMHDNSKIVFEVSALLIIENALIGQNCLWDGRGSHAMAPGEDGAPGKSISSVAIFKELGSLIVITDGGHGANGKSGTSGTAGLNGSQFADGSNGDNGQSGGNGADAGDIRFYYSCVGFIPAFNEAREHAFSFSSKGGNRGAGGRGGRGGSGGMPTYERDNVKDKGVVVGNKGKAGQNGLTGALGNNGKDGQFILKKFDPGQ